MLGEARRRRAPRGSRRRGRPSCRSAPRCRRRRARATAPRARAARASRRCRPRRPRAHRSGRGSVYSHMQTSVMTTSCGSSLLERAHARCCTGPSSSHALEPVVVLVLGDAEQQHAADAGRARRRARRAAARRPTSGATPGIDSTGCAHALARSARTAAARAATARGASRARARGAPRCAAGGGGDSGEDSGIVIESSESAAWTRSAVRYSGCGDGSVFAARRSPRESRRALAAQLVRPSRTPLSAGSVRDRARSLPRTIALPSTSAMKPCSTRTPSGAGRRARRSAPGSRPRARRGTRARRAIGDASSARRSARRRAARDRARRRRGSARDRALPRRREPRRRVEVGGDALLRVEPMQSRRGEDRRVHLSFVDLFERASARCRAARRPRDRGAWRAAARAGAGSTSRRASRAAARRATRADDAPFTTSTSRGSSRSSTAPTIEALGRTRSADPSASARSSRTLPCARSSSSSFVNSPFAPIALSGSSSRLSPTVLYVMSSLCMPRAASAACTCRACRSASSDERVAIRRGVTTGCSESTDHASASALLRDVRDAPAIASRPVWRVVDAFDFDFDRRASKPVRLARRGRS